MSKAKLDTGKPRAEPLWGAFSGSFLWAPASGCHMLSQVCSHSWPPSPPAQLQPWLRGAQGAAGSDGSARRLTPGGGCVWSGRGLGWRTVSGTSRADTCSSQRAASGLHPPDASLKDSSPRSQWPDVTETQPRPLTRPCPPPPWLLLSVPTALVTP